MSYVSTNETAVSQRSKRPAKTVALILMAILMMGLLAACGDKGEAGDAIQQSSETGTEQNTDQTAENPVVDESVKGTPDAMTGDWAFLCRIIRTDSDDMQYESVYSCRDTDAPDSEIHIRKEDEKFLADYKFAFYEANTMLYGAELQYKQNPEYEGMKDAAWCMEATDPFAEKIPGNEYYRFFITDEDRLVVFKDYYNDPEDEYYYHYTYMDIYLRKGSPQFDDPENICYLDTVTVSNATELLNSIRNNRRIILKAGEYNFSAVSDKDVTNSMLKSEYGAYEVQDAYNLCLEAEDGADVQFCIEDPYMPVVSFECGRNIKLSGITAGHKVEPGYCSGSVLRFDNVSGIDIDSCNLYGCGTYGLEASYCYDINVTNTDIYECTYGLVSLIGSGDTLFENCTLRDSKDLSMITLESVYNINFENCEFRNNVSDAFDGVYFVQLGEYDSATFKKCSFVNNRFNAFSNYEVTMEDCTSDNNHAGFSDMLNSSVKETVPDKESILENYKITLQKQQDIESKLQSDSFMSQPTLNNLASEEYEMWDTLLNRIWSYLGGTLEESEMEALRTEQKNWIRDKEAKMKAAGEENGGGTMQPMLEYGTGADETRKRVEELITQFIDSEFVATINT